ncbi:hypothetical protein JCM10450v2_006361 [Rhodotorula kratochvilovae]
MPGLLAPIQPSAPPPSSRKRRLSFKILPNPFRRAPEPPEFDLSPFPPPLPSPAENDAPTVVAPVMERKSSKASSVLSKKLRRRSLVSLIRPDKADEGKGVVEEKSATKMGGVNWEKRMAGHALPSAAASIKAEWINQQQPRRDDVPKVTLHASHDSVTSVRGFLYPFPSHSNGMISSTFGTSPIPEAKEGLPNLGYSTYSPPPGSPTHRDLMRVMAKPFPPSRPTSMATSERRRSLSVTGSGLMGSPLPSSELGDDRMAYMFPTPPPRGSGSSGTSATSTSPSTPVVKAPTASNDLPSTLLPRPSAPSSTPDAPPARPPRPESALEPRAHARVLSPVLERRRPMSVGMAPTVSAPASSSPAGHVRRASVAHTGDVPSPAESGSTTPTARKPITIPPQLGGRRVSASLLSSGMLPAPAHAHSAGSNRASWASVQSQAESVGSTASTSSGGRRRRFLLLGGGGSGAGSDKSHRRTESGATAALQERAEPARWQPAEQDILEREKENVGVGAGAMGKTRRDGAGAVIDEVERRRFEEEADAIFSDARMRALVRELGI